MSATAHQKEPFAEIEALGAGALAMLDLPAAHYGGYYEGFANSALWPALHSRTDLIRATQEDYLSYREVNAFMARALLRFQKPDTVFWVQDYHFLALGAELRDLGVTQPIGFFLHTPWPARAVIGGVPHHRELVEAMLAYDLIGFQTEDDCENFLSYVAARSRSRRAGWRGQFAPRQLAGRGVSDRHRSREIRPAGRQGGDASGCVAAAAQPERREAGDRRRPAGLFQGAASTASRRSTGCGPCSRGSRAPSRCCRSPRRRAARIEAYGNLQSELAKLVSDVNGRHGEVDWTPIRYLNKGFGQTVLAGLYRTAQVGVVTPLHDGMNLVAKEYVAAQNPADPGVLVLSKFAGAANELDTALMVNPHDIDGMAQDHRDRAVDAAERAADALGSDDGEAHGSTIQQWFADFVDALQETHFDKERDRAADRGAAALWPLRSANQRAVSLSTVIPGRCAASNPESRSRAHAPRSCFARPE